jgi:hypothetical protein
MYTHYSMNVQAAKDRQRGLLAEAERERRIRQLRDSAPASQPPATHSRSRAYQLLQLLRAQAQSL